MSGSVDPLRASGHPEPARLELSQPPLVPRDLPQDEGLKSLGHLGDIVPRILDESLIEERIPVTPDNALATCRPLAAQKLFVGPSPGASFRGALRLAGTARFRAWSRC